MPLVSAGVWLDDRQSFTAKQVPTSANASASGVHDLYPLPDELARAAIHQQGSSVRGQLLPVPARQWTTWIPEQEYLGAWWDSCLSAPGLRQWDLPLPAWQQHAQAPHEAIWLFPEHYPLFSLSVRGRSVDAPVAFFSLVIDAWHFPAWLAPAAQAQQPFPVGPRRFSLPPLQEIFVSSWLPEATSVLPLPRRSPGWQDSPPLQFFVDVTNFLPWSSPTVTARAALTTTQAVVFFDALATRGAAAAAAEGMPLSWLKTEATVSPGPAERQKLLPSGEKPNTGDLSLWLPPSLSVHVPRAARRWQTVCFAAPDSTAVNLVVIAGPYYITSGDLYSGGAVAGQGETG